MPAQSFHIVRVATNGHYAMYDELAASLAASLAELGHECSAALNETRAGAINILLGSTLFAARYQDMARRLQGQPYLLYQVEQLDDRFGLLPDWPEYRQLLAEAEGILDYGPSSTAYLQARGRTDVVTLPPGYHSCLERFRPAPQPDIDVLFIGSPHPRRQRVLDALKRAGAGVVHLRTSYGVRRDGVIARAKIVLNMHAWDELDALETIRLSPLLANRCFVVSEKGDHNPYGAGLVFAEYGALVDTCLHYLRQPAEHRRLIAERGYQALRAQPMAETVRRAVGAA